MIEAAYVFIDIDGCLAPFGRDNPDVWGEEECANLRELVVGFAARLVLVSSWPEQAARDQLSALDIPVYGALHPAYRSGLDWHPMWARGCGYTLREAGIFLTVQARQPRAWCWIDDWWARKHVPQNHYSAGHYVACDWSVSSGSVKGRGFDAEALTLAKTILGGR